MRTLAIGDVHGCLTALDTVLSNVQPTQEDRLVFLGDYVDRGPDSRGVLDRLLELREKHNVICLTGNHEVMMKTARDDDGMYLTWLGYGGEETLESYLHADLENPLEPHIDIVPERHWKFLDVTCLPFFETDTHIFVHANVEPGLPMVKQDEAMLFWEKFTNGGPHVSGKTVICGHTSQKSGWPLNVGHAICIDTWVYGEEGFLSCLDVETGHFWQANQRGEHRQAVLA